VFFLDKIFIIDKMQIARMFVALTPQKVVCERRDEG
jgi:hypothetical protein